MKIAFIGTHGIGKTTQAHELVSLLKKSGINAVFLGELARKCPFPINEDRTKKSQIWIMLNQIIKEMEDEDNSQVLVCDRSVLDSYCYYIEKFGRSEVFEPLVKTHLKTYGLIIKMSLNNSNEKFLKDDKKRSVNKDFQIQIDKTINKMLKVLRVNYIEHKNNKETLEFIKKIINTKA